MPPSKRARIISTSKTRKDRKVLVRRLHESIQTCASEHSYIFVFDVQNMRNQLLKQVRRDFADSRIVMGKTKVMMVALGRDKENECVPGVSQLGEYVRGEIGLLFTSREPKEVEGYFDAYRKADYARSGGEAAWEVRIPNGEITTQFGVEGGEDDPLPMAIEPQLRKLGVPTRIKAGKVVLEDAAEGEMIEDGEEGYLVCKEGDSLDSRQTTILKILGVRMAEFKVALRAVYDKQAEEVRSIGAMDVDDGT